jgi:hypothetical protein
MSRTNHDPNPAKYLVVYGDDPVFTAALRDLNDTDFSIGEVNEIKSNSVMVRYLNILLCQREDEIQDRILQIQDRILQIQDRDKELQRLIDEIHRIYSSKRYRVGHVMINPIETVIRLIRKVI